jgi:hypothetical protein
LPKRHPRHRAPRPTRRSLIGTLLIALPFAVAFGITAVVAHPVQPAPAAQSLTAAERTIPSTSDRKHRKREQPPPEAVNPNCTLTVPANPLTAQGLASPYQLSGSGRDGACHEANANQSAFVEATILDPATGALSVYRPLVIDGGTRPAAPPVVPALPAGAVVGIWFGFNGHVLTLRGTGDSLTQGACVNGLPGSMFGQFAYCNAPALFTAANTAIANKQLLIPPLGTGKDGRPCPTIRDFGVVDQDQSDNVTTTYLATDDGRTAQVTGARIAGATTLTNGSDNGLLANFIDPAVGCAPFTAPDLTNGRRPATSLALDELQGAALQAPPAALVPLNDPMTLVENQRNVAKTNLYRAGVGQPPVNADTETPRAYCANLATTGNRRLALDRNLFRHAPSPDAEAANLFDFLTQRLQGSLQLLDCSGR